MKNLRTNYVILSYEVMYRFDKHEDWNKESFSSEELALKFFKEVLKEKYQCKLLKVEALESWWPV